MFFSEFVASLRESMFRVESVDRYSSASRKASKFSNTDFTASCLLLHLVCMQRLTVILEFFTRMSHRCVLDEKTNKDSNAQKSGKKNGRNSNLLSDSAVQQKSAPQPPPVDVTDCKMLDLTTLYMPLLPEWFSCCYYAHIQLRRQSGPET